jgi:CPA2 family monovalent cation:H+ antiporter-2
MPHDTPLIATIVAGLGLAFVLGALANRLKASPIVGYLLAGIAVGPHTPGFVADQALANELAEIGVILLMFGVGLHFSWKDLMSVRTIAVPGAIVQIAIATLLGIGLSSLMGWPIITGIVFGLALSVASTVVLLRALQERRILNSEQGRIAVGWLIVEDIFMVLALVLLPTIAPILSGAAGDSGAVASALLFTILKIGAFFVVMLAFGRRVIPWLLHRIAHTGSRELFRLGVLAIALGVAFGSAKLFGVSFALGAFFAGMILKESELSQQAAAETLPLRDAFAVLFFVSVGMLFNPNILVTDTLPVIATVAIIVIGKSLAALAIVVAFGHPLSTALTISASLAQIGEFSFILAGLGVALAVLPEAGRDLILAGALISILLNPVAFMALDRLTPWLEKRTGQPAAAPPAPPQAAAPRVPGHAVVVGVGRIGSRIADGLIKAGITVCAVDERDEMLTSLRERKVESLTGSGIDLLDTARIAEAQTLFVAIPEGFEAGNIIEAARAANAGLRIYAHAHSDTEESYLLELGADVVIKGEDEIAAALVSRYLAEEGRNDRKRA